MFQLLQKVAIAISLAELITLPLSTIKTNLQNSNTNSIVEISRNIMTTRGIRGFFASGIPTLITPIVSKSTKYIIYKTLDTMEDYPIKNKFINGLTTGVITSIVTHPLDFIKVHLQMNKPIILRNVYRGYSKTLLKVSISTTLLFPLYEYISKDNNQIASAIFSSFVVTTALQPLDYMKTRQIYGLGHGTQYFKGFGLNLMKKVPNFLITTCLLEEINKIKF